MVIFFKVNQQSTAVFFLISKLCFFFPVIILVVFSQLFITLTISNHGGVFPGQNDFHYGSHRLSWQGCSREDAMGSLRYEKVLYYG